MQESQSSIYKHSVYPLPLQIYHKPDINHINDYRRFKWEDIIYYLSVHPYLIDGPPGLYVNREVGVCAQPPTHCHSSKCFAGVDHYFKIQYLEHQSQ